MHDSERVLKAIVHGAGIDLIRPRKLADAAQPLESGFGNNLPLPVVERYESVNRTPDFVCSVWVQGVNPAGVDNVPQRANKRRMSEARKSCSLRPLRLCKPANIASSFCFISIVKSSRNEKGKTELFNSALCGCVYNHSGPDVSYHRNYEIIRK
jgi:hypothetical protein